jgi:hypothetical protein
LGTIKKTLLKGLDLIGLEMIDADKNAA